MSISLERCTQTVCYSVAICCRAQYLSLNQMDMYYMLSPDFSIQEKGHLVEFAIKNDPDSNIAKNLRKIGGQP